MAKGLKVALALGAVALLTATAAFAASDRGAASDTLVYGASADPSLLDPSLTSDGESLRPTGQIFDSLVGFKKGTSAQLVGRGVAVLLAAYGLVLLVGAARGATNPLTPFTEASIARQEALGFKRIKTLADLEREVAGAKADGKSVMLDFYADWCVSCKEMEHDTFTEAEVKKALANTRLLQADVTANDDADRALLQHFGIFGPPTIAFYGVDGSERRNFRVVGFMKAAEFAAVIRQAVAPATPSAQ